VAVAGGRKQYYLRFTIYEFYLLCFSAALREAFINNFIQQPAKMNTCPKCNTPVKPNARFCHVCGYQFTTSFSGTPQVTNFERPSNRQTTYAFIWLFITLASLVCMILPFVSEIDIFNGGGAMIFIGFVMFLTGAIVTPFYFKRAKRFNNIVSGINILAYWIYLPEEWGEYAKAEFKKRKKEKWTLFWLITIIALIINIIMCIVHPDGIIIFVFVQLGLMLIIGLTAFLSYKIPGNINKNHAGRAIIAPYGIYLNGSFHSWQGLSARFEKVQFTDNNSVLEFTYSAMVRYGRENYTVNVPVPKNEASSAVRIIEYFNRLPH
jgi:hypothetical protein